MSISRRTPPAATAASADDPLFLLHAIEERVPAPGAVFYAGTVELPMPPELKARVLTWVAEWCRFGQ